MGNLKELFDLGDKQAFNAVLVEEFHNAGSLEMLLEKLANEEVKLTRKQVIGKLAIMGEKNIVPKVAKVPKNTGPSKKEMIKNLCDMVNLVPADLLTFNNVKKSELATLIKAIDVNFSEA
jgi:hypothetical protein